jgi:ribosomal protein L15E
MAPSQQRPLSWAIRIRRPQKASQMNLRKCHRPGVKSSDHSGNQKQSKRTRRSTGRRASLAALPSKMSTESNIDKWFETILTAEASQADSNGSNQTKSPRLGTKYNYSHRLLSFTYHKLILCHRPCKTCINPVLA